MRPRPRTSRTHSRDSSGLSRAATCSPRSRTFSSTRSRRTMSTAAGAGGEGQLVAAEGADVRPGGPAVQRLVVEDHRDRGADAAEGLGRDDDVGLDVVLLEGEPGPGAPAPGLDLVDDERDAELAGQGPHAPDELAAWPG